MIFDIAVGLFFAAQVISGYKQGFLKTVLKTIGYIAGAIAGLYLAIEYDKSAWVVLAIFAGAGLGTLAGALIAKALKLTIVRGPLAWINSLAGAAIEAVKILVLAYIVGTVLLIAPWPTGQNAMLESKVYLKLDTYAPSLLANLRDNIEELFINPLN